MEVFIVLLCIIFAVGVILSQTCDREIGMVLRIAVLAIFAFFVVLGAAGDLFIPAAETTNALNAGG